MDILKIAKRNPVSVLFGVGILACLALSSGNVKQQMQSLSQVRELAQQNSAKEMKLRATEDFMKQQAEIAANRYKSGCVMVVAMKNPNYYTALSEGQPVIDRVRRIPLPAGTVVCDSNGSTGILEPAADGTPVVSAIAFTGDRALVEAARNRNKSTRYALPNQ
ncbi:hypothetical protein [Scytonema sp. PCC 10023]|uniref:hypothetical protein n=1 Tax=Scytonema sp. PCC 10023 TaxID=1680591 RepID=UPI0039C60239